MHLQSVDNGSMQVRKKYLKVFLLLGTKHQNFTFLPGVYAASPSCEIISEFKRTPPNDL